jgi:hypothetical protein
MATSVRVPDDGELRLGPVRLPAGRPLRWRANDPVTWLSEAPVPEPGPVWCALSALHGQTGLVPILAPGRRGEDLEAAAFGEMAVVGDVDQVDVAAILEHRWIDRPGTLALLRMEAGRQIGAAPAAASTWCYPR